MRLLSFCFHVNGTVPHLDRWLALITSPQGFVEPVPARIVLFLDGNDRLGRTPSKQASVSVSVEYAEQNFYDFWFLRLSAVFNGLELSWLAPVDQSVKTPEKAPREGTTVGTRS